ncbi:MAG: SDR family NAD(P)-dependent oxidoreductase [Pseudomonadota bacterium]
MVHSARKREAAIQIDQSIPLITGSNRGLGAAFIDELFERGAEKIYAGARDPDNLADAVVRHGDKLIPLQLDVTQPDQIQAAVDQCSDVNILVSNAAITCIKPILSEPTIDDFRETMEINYFGPLQLIRGFAPVLARNGGGGIMQVVSMAGLLCATAATAYSASKAACAMLCQGVMAETEEQGTLVSISYPGFFDTRMADGFDVPKPTPRQIARNTVDGFENGQTAVFPDTFSKMTRDAMLKDMDSVFNNQALVVGQLVGAFMTHPEAGQ